MALETATYINGLVATNPTAGDPVSQGDDHARLIKSTILATFPNITGAVTPTHTELNYVDGVTSAIQTQLDQATTTSGTAASASGTAVDYTGVPSWAKKITVVFSAVSTNGGADLIIQIGDSGGVETSGYESGASVLSAASVAAYASSTAGFIVAGATVASSLSGSITLSRVNSATNTWVASGVTFRNDTTDIVTSAAGMKSTSAALDRVRITTANGTDAFDAGTVNIIYE